MMEYFILVFAFIFMLGFYMRFKNFFRALFLGAISGLLTLIVLGYFAAEYIKITIFTVLISLVVGAPGVLFLVLFNMFF